MEKSEYRILIKHCFLMGKNTVQTKKWLDKCYGESSPSRQMVEKWIAEFKRGRKSTSDGQRSGRPKEVTTEEMSKKIHDIAVDNPKVKVRDIAEKTGISVGSVISILHHNWGMKKLDTGWVHSELTINQKREGVPDSEQSSNHIVKRSKTK